MIKKILKNISSESRDSIFLYCKNINLVLNVSLKFKLVKLGHKQKQCHVTE